LNFDQVFERVSSLIILAAMFKRESKNRAKYKKRIICIIFNMLTKRSKFADPADVKKK
jgi:hypothetical protein